MKIFDESDTTCKASDIVTIRTGFFLALLLFVDSGCTPKYITRPFVHTKSNNDYSEFLSSFYNHFEDGVFFSDVEFGLDVLWRASFKNGNTYKENLGFFVPGGLLISPNKENTRNSANLQALRKQTEDGKLFVFYNSTRLEVLGIIHTHPDIHSKPMPAPRNDYQYGYLGIHNYVMDHHNLFDAYKDSKGRECYKRLGSRSAYHTIQFMYSNSALVRKDNR